MRPFSSKRLLFELALLVLVPSHVVMSGGGELCFAPHYRIVRLPLQPSSINDFGEVAGTSPAGRAAVWTAKHGMQVLPLPPGFDFSEATSIDRLGHVTVVATNPKSRRYQAYLVHSGTITLLDGLQTRAYQIDTAGNVAGDALGNDGKTNPVVWTGGTLRTLVTCCGGSAKGIGAGSIAIGSAYDDRGIYRAFSWTAAAGMQMIGPPDGYSSAIAINDRGHIVMQASLESFLLIGAQLTRLQLSPRYPSQPRAINDCDVVVGSFGPYSDAARAFLWDRTRGFEDLNDLAIGGSDWTLKRASGINQQGAIVGKGDFRRKEDVGFLLLPER